MTNGSVVELSHDWRQQDKDSHDLFRSAGQSRPGMEESLMATLASAISLMEATARIQRETAEILCAVATRGENDTVIQRLKLAEDAIQALTLAAGARPDRLERLQRRPKDRRQANSQGESLTAREETVLRFLGGTLSLREIGQALYVSQNTIKSHTRAIYQKLGVSNRHNAIKRSRELGILLQGVQAR